MASSFVELAGGTLIAAKSGVQRDPDGGLHREWVTYQYPYTMFPDNAIYPLICVEMFPWRSLVILLTNGFDQPGDYRFYAATKSVAAVAGLHQTYTSGVNAGGKGYEIVATSQTIIGVAGTIMVPTPPFLLSTFQVDAGAASGTYEVTLIGEN